MRAVTLPPALAVFAILSVLSGPAAAQAPHVCEGNGLAPLSIAISPAYLGAALEIDLKAPTAPGGVVLLAKATAVGPVFHPLLGWSCLDVFAPGLQLFPLGLDGAGAVHVSLALPPVIALVGAPPIFLSPALPTPGGIVLGKTVPVYLTFPDSWSPAGALPAPRGFLQATALGDGPEDDRIDVLLSGGGDRSLVEPGSKSETWIYHPLTRSFEAGPLMSVARNFHTQTKLADGRVLILGGCDALGVCHPSGEIYDHDTGSLTSIAPMAARRSGHAATLLDDGRVLVTGGLSDYQNAMTALKAALDTAQDTAEIYDPATDSWVAAATPMGSPRTGHSQVRWHDGRILVLMGINSGAISVGLETADLTGSCDWFDPLSGMFQPAPAESFPSYAGRAFFGTSFLGSGELLVAGGLEDPYTGFGGAWATGRVSRFDGASWLEQTSSFGPISIPVAAAFPTQGTLPDGRALIVGGFSETLEFLEGVDQVVATDALDGTGTFPDFAGEPLAALGTGTGQPGGPSLRGGHAMVELFDGTFLVVGGMNGSETAPVGTWALDDAFIYAP